MTAREAAYLSLLRCEKAGKYTNIEADAAIKKYSLEDSDRALYTTLVYGVTEREITLDHIITLFSSKKGKKISPEVKTILRLGLYQIMFLDRIPEHAAVNESVELSKKFARGTQGFVNALLRAAIRGKDSITYPDKATEAGVPNWMYDSFLRDYGKEKADEILSSLLTPSRLTLRCNTLKCDEESLIKSIEVPCEKTKYAPHGVRLCENMAITDFAPLADGYCFVQDEASQLAAGALEAERTMTVIDACACPGGKSFSAALDMENTGKIISCDLHENKLTLIENGAKRLGISIIETRAQDARKLIPDFEGKADRVICDVPCSGLGILKKKPDIRKKSEEEISGLCKVQYDILENCAKYLKQGGILIYSTCTLRKAENENITDKFIKSHGEYEYVPINGDSGKVTIFPKDGIDGFYIAKIKRK